MVLEHGQLLDLVVSITESSFLTKDIVIQKKNDDRCSERKELFKFFNWALTNDEAKARSTQQVLITRRNQFISQGFVPLTQKVVDQILDIFYTLTCSGAPLFRYEQIEQHKGTGFPFFLGLAMFLLLCTIVMGSALLRDKRTSRPGLLYASLLLLGGRTLNIFRVNIRCLNVCFGYILVPSTRLQLYMPIKTMVYSHWILCPLNRSIFSNLSNNSSLYLYKANRQALY